MDLTGKTGKCADWLRRAEYNERGLCAGCYRPLGKERMDKMYCAMCKATYTEYKALWRDAHPEHKERDLRGAKERREKRKAEHKCTRCGVVLPDDETRLNCDGCRKKLSVYYKAWRKGK